MIDFRNISYLKLGNDRQKKAYEVLLDLEIFEQLDQYQPILVGTIPIEINLPHSDLDIICYCENHKEFADKLTDLYQHKDSFDINKYFCSNIKATVATFEAKGFELEIFGQAVPSIQQNAYRHLLIEHQLLLKHGSDFRAEIIKLKAQGLNTEAAFAQLLGLSGDPFKALLEYEIK